VNVIRIEEDRRNDRYLVYSENEVVDFVIHHLRDTSGRIVGSVRDAALQAGFITPTRHLTEAGQVAARLYDKSEGHTEILFNGRKSRPDDNSLHA
jgi:hypothetical protein